jgi:hypothetical protein
MTIITISDSLERLTPLIIGGFSPQKELFTPYFSMHELPKPMKISEPATYRPIMMKFVTQTEKNVPNPKNTKPEVCGHFSRWPPPPS